MRIKKIISQSRRDFKALYKCEHCGNEKEHEGYDDTFFHKEVIPGMKCAECGEIAGADYVPRATKYPDSQTV